MWREKVVLGARAVSDNQLVGVTFDGGGSGKAEHETDTRLYSMTLMHTPSDRVRVAPVKSLVLGRDTRALVLFFLPFYSSSSSGVVLRNVHSRRVVARPRVTRLDTNLERRGGFNDGTFFSDTVSVTLCDRENLTKQTSERSCIAKRRTNFRYRTITLIFHSISLTFGDLLVNTDGMNVFFLLVSFGQRNVVREKLFGDLLT